MQRNSHDLWKNVLDRAYKDARWKLGNDRFFKLKIWMRHIPALAWFNLKTNAVGSLDWICEMLGIYEADKIRKVVNGLTITESIECEHITELLYKKERRHAQKNEA